MALFSLVDLEGKDVENVLIIGLAGVAGYFLYRHLSQAQANNTASAYQQASNATTQGLEDLQQLALLQALEGTTAQTGATTQTTTQAPAPVIPIIGATSGTTSSMVGSNNPGSV